MLGPSGFFVSNGLNDNPLTTNELELIHTSLDGFNVLYRGCKNGRFFIYKALKPEYAKNPVYKDLLKKDFNIGFSLNHPSICQYYAMVNLPQIGDCIVLEWIDGETLEELIKSNRIGKEKSQKIICELCDALGYMHSKQIIHRDLKPENIMITHNGQNVKVIDFGLSDADSYGTFKAPAGTRIYASPELAAGETIDNRSDIWSLGVIINEISRDYKHVTRKCLQRDREKRLAYASDVKKAILASGRRTFLGWAIVFAISLAAVLSYIYISPKAPNTLHTPPAQYGKTAPDSTITETPTKNIVKEVVETNTDTKKDRAAAQQKDTARNIDAQSLENLFDDALKQIY